MGILKKSVNGLTKVFKSKPFKILFIVIIALIAMQFIGIFLIVSGAWVHVDQFNSSLKSYSLVLQSISLVFATYFYPSIVSFFIERKLKKQGISFEDLPTENQERVLLLKSRWVCVALLAVFMILANI